ncbi:hypothetical protein BKA00_002882 [Actinomadura coerulea]|uniref:DUF397 domain-containing protein n=1 Tax=Actinomadura coerulea TaxID=46159 RepID=A0A7X0FYA2_9ACTN|nr:DUF397 domain-containing protein [Actinomadura coerulea]MBB6395968.1 hypothetical protein [Actinomadura coerulea]GGQ30671.1 hypothetical protein GCM10010187_54440 [Actinomadura coerulea]
MTKSFHGWRKSRHSEPNGGCIEAGRAADGTIGVRDTKLDGTGPILEFTADAWRTLLRSIRSAAH